MIAKRIDAKPGHDNYGQLGRYIVDASHEGEKILFAWHEGCLSENLDAALCEIEATQNMNTRCRGGKTYHLLVSFRPEDEVKLTEESVRDIEKSFAEALGLSGHQRICGVHKNTNNMHLHVAYNLINPEKFTKKEPFRDFYKLSEVCRAMEKKYGLVIDKGMNEQQPTKKINQRAASMEAHSGEQSFQSFVLECKNEILQGLADAETWQDAHAVLAKYGLEVKPHGNGLVLANSKGKETVKASNIDRGLSKKRLQDRFGEYTPPKKDFPAPAKQYERKPMQPKSPKRARLYKQYQTEAKRRKESLELATKQNAADLLLVRTRYEQERQTLEKRILPRKTKVKLRQILKSTERIALEQCQLSNKERLQEARSAYPFHNWNGYLKWQAGLGDKTALEVLQSRLNEKSIIENDESLEAPKNRRNVKLEALGKEQQIIVSTINKKHKTGLIAITRMEQLAAQEALQLDTGKGRQMFSGVQNTIDNNGIVIFKLPQGGTIRDTGKMLYFSPDELTQKAAMIYAHARFGKRIQLKDNTIEQKKYERKLHHKSNFTGLAKILENGLRKLSSLNVVRFGKRAKMLLPDHARPDVER